MALSAFSKRFAAYDVTPIENLFLLEYMPHASGDYVRVYLYGLMQCHHPDADATIDGMARVLGLKPEQVLQAFRYWEQKGLVTCVSDNPPAFQYENVRSAMLENTQIASDGAYQYKDFVSELQSILGLLHPQQLQKAMEWVEDLHLPPEVVLLIVREKSDQLTDGGKKKRSIPYLFKVFENIALDFANRGLCTAEAADKELSRGRPSFKMAMTVLDYFNLRRSPTTAEVELCQKWIDQWQIDERALTGALKQTTGSSNPSFAYLDRILERHSTAAQSDGGVLHSIEKEKQIFEIGKQILVELGQLSRAPSQDQRDAIQGWLDQGFQPDALLRAAARCNRSGRRSFDQLSVELRRWFELGITSKEAADAYNQTRDELRQQAAQLFDRAGIDRKPTESDLDQLREWLKSAPYELVMYAAECAHGLKLPTRSMAKNLSEWAKKGIADVESARSERASRAGVPKEKPTTAPAQPPAAQSYEQRQYSADFFDDFFADLSTPEEDI